MNERDVAKGLSIVHRRRPTVLAGPEHRSLPLHSKPVSCIDIPAIRRRLQQSALTRFDHLFALLAVPGTPVLPRSTFARDDCRLLCEHGIISAVSPADLRERPTTGSCLPFDVLEEKPEGDRRRAILWPADQNAAVYERGFSSSVPLEHVSRYTDAGIHSWGATCDLRVGFYQVALPERLRQNYRFQDADGTVYEMHRLPMGHCVSVDIMQIVIEAIVGAKQTVRPEFAGPLSPAAWVDGAMAAGSRAQVAEACAFWAKSAEQVGATFKAPPEPLQRLDFIGVDFNFRAHSVRLAQKTLGKLPAKIKHQITVEELEQLVGRLIFGAGVTRTALGRYYYALKQVKRLFNRCNRGAIKPTDVVDLSNGTVAQLSRLLAAVTLTVPVRLRHAAPLVSLFTDASLEGWGAVLTDNFGRVLVAGARWPKRHTESGDMAILEAAAVRAALASFSNELCSAGALTVVVDNTSVLAGVSRGTARSERLAPLVAAAAESIRDLDVPAKIAYIGSKKNPADIPSRDSSVQTASPAVLSKVRLAQPENFVGLRCASTGEQGGVRAIGERPGCKPGFSSLSSVPSSKVMGGLRKLSGPCTAL